MRRDKSLQTPTRGRPLKGQSKKRHVRRDLIRASLPAQGHLARLKAGSRNGSLSRGMFVRLYLKVLWKLALGFKGLGTGQDEDWILSRGLAYSGCGFAGGGSSCSVTNSECAVADSGHGERAVIRLR